MPVMVVRIHVQSCHSSYLKWAGRPGARKLGNTIKLQGALGVEVHGITVWHLKDVGFKDFGKDYGLRLQEFRVLIM